MKKTILGLCCLMMTLAVGAKDTKEFKGKTVSFQYPEFLKVAVSDETDSLTTISLKDENGSELDVNIMIPSKGYTVKEYSTWFNQNIISYLFQRVGFGNFTMKKVESDSLTTVTIGQIPASGFNFTAQFSGQPLYGKILSAKVDKNHFVAFSACAKDSALVERMQTVTSTITFAGTEKSTTAIGVTADSTADASTVEAASAQDKGEKVYDVVEEMPSFPGGTSELMKFLGSNTVYPDSAYNNGIAGKVVVSFVVEKDGSIGEIKVLKPVDRLLDDEAMRVVKSMPAWTPGKQNGVPVRVKYNVPISFKLPEAPKQPDLRILTLTSNVADNFEASALGQIVAAPDTPASFPGGDEALNEYVATNLYYPPHLRNFGIEDTVTLEFVVEKDGQLSNIQVTKYQSETLAKQALILVQGMPKWTPAQDRKGNAVRSKASMDIEFRK